jgi:hypothetical protein
MSSERNVHREVQLKTSPHTQKVLLHSCISHAMSVCCYFRGVAVRILIHTYLTPSVNVYLLNGLTLMNRKLFNVTVRTDAVI